MEASDRQHELIMAGDLSNREIARLTGVNHQRIAYLRSTTEGAPPSPASPRTKWDRKAGLKLIMEGKLTNIEIAKQLKATVTAVSSMRNRTKDAPPSPAHVRVNRPLIERLVKSRTMTDGAIAAESGAGRTSVRLIRQDMGFPPIVESSVIEYDAEVKRLSEQQVSIKRQARLLDISPRQVERSRQRQKLTTRTANRPITAERHAAAQSLFDEDASYAEVHRTTGINTKYLRKHWPEKGWTQEQAAEYRHARQRAREAGIDL